MKTDQKPLIKVPHGLGSSILSWIVIALVCYIAGVRSLETLMRFVSKGGWAILVGIYVFDQLYSSSWLLYEDKLVVKRPWRPFYNRFEFPLEDIEKVTFTIPNIGKLNPWLKVYCKNKRFRIYDFGFSGNRDKMEQLLSMLKEKGIEVKYPPHEPHIGDGF